MELRLLDCAGLIGKVESIYNKIIADEFEHLCGAGLASPSSPAEYRGALKSLLRGGVLTPIPAGALGDGYVFPAGADGAGYAIHVEFYANGAPSGIFGVFLARPAEPQPELTVSLYDILMP